QDVAPAHREQLVDRRAARLAGGKRSRPSADVTADLDDRLVARTKRTRRFAPALDEETMHKSERLRREARRVQHSRHLQLAFADCTETGELQQDPRSEEHTSELQSRGHLVCRLLLEKKKSNQ